MAEPKTKPTGKSIKKFIDAVKDERRRSDCRMLVKLMTRLTKSKPKLWGPSIVGFGSYHYVYQSGREGDWPLTGFSPRKQNLTIYIMSGVERNRMLLKRLGKFKTGKSCLYVRSLEDIDIQVLEAMIKESLRVLASQYARKQENQST